MTKGLVVLAMLLAGCDLYFGGNGDDVPPCPGYATDGGGAPMAEVRDPYTGMCQPVQYPDYPCDDVCGPCPAIGIAQPDWGACYGQCSGLGEQACFATPGCYAAYLDVNDGNGNGNELWGCWDTAPSGPVQGACENLDAHECSRHDNCVAIYEQSSPNAVTQFDHCAAEPASSCAAVDCAPGFHCEQQCDPSAPNAMCGAVCVADQTCASVDCAPGYTCADVCTTGPNGQTVCSPTCVPTSHDPGQCTGAVICGMPAPACPAGTTPGIANGCYTGYCIPNSACSPGDPGECYGAVLCDALPPTCPTGTVAGVANGCWTGFCIPEAACPMAACASLASEPACLSRSDCRPIYDGHQCTCDINGCTCLVLTYARCEAL